MASVTGLGWQGGSTVETEKAQSRENAQLTRRVPTVSCPLCWALSPSLPISLQCKFFPTYIAALIVLSYLLIPTVLTLVIPIR